MSLRENPSEGKLSKRAGNPEGDRGRRLILLVEDNEADRDVYGGLLWYNGYDVLHAENGEEALRVAADARPDLILLDIMLPGELSGLDVAARLRDLGVNVPILVLSAVPREELLPLVEKVGITAYLEKPIDPFKVVREVMRRVGAAQGDG